MHDAAPPLTVPSRFRGPERSGNGGWVAGALASYLPPGPVRVTLRQPPPLDVGMDVALDGDPGDPGSAATLTRNGEVVAEASPSGDDLVAVDPVTTDEARTAEAGFSGHRFHPFPGCFACGTDRGTGDGLRIFPGRVEDDDQGRVRVASAWTPDPSLGGDTAPLPVTWAALDCVGGWAGDLEQRLMVLGMISADVRDLPRVGEEHLVVGGARGSSGRRTFTAATLYDPRGQVLARAEHVWVAIDPETFG